jgi:hypothetical protein
MISKCTTLYINKNSINSIEEILRKKRNLKRSQMPMKFLVTKTNDGYMISMVKTVWNREDRIFAFVILLISSQRKSIVRIWLFIHINMRSKQLDFDIIFCFFLSLHWIYDVHVMNCRFTGGHFHAGMYPLILAMNTTESETKAIRLFFCCVWWAWFVLTQITR